MSVTYHTKRFVATRCEAHTEIGLVGVPPIHVVKGYSTKEGDALMNTDIAKGKMKQIKDKVKEGIGITGAKSREIRGKTEQVAGKIQEKYGKVKRSIKKATGA